MARSSSNDLLLRGLGRGRSGRVRSSGSGAIGRSSRRVGSRGSRLGSRSSRFSGRRSGGIRSCSFLLAAGGHQRKGRDRSGKGNVQFHVGVPQKYLVVSETKQTFVAICIAARILSESPTYLKQLQKFVPVRRQRCAAGKANAWRERSSRAANRPKSARLLQCINDLRRTRRA